MGEFGGGGDPTDPILPNGEDIRMPLTPQEEFDSIMAATEQNHQVDRRGRDEAVWMFANHNIGRKMPSGKEVTRNTPLETVAEAFPDDVKGYVYGLILNRAKSKATAEWVLGSVDPQTFAERLDVSRPWWSQRDRSHTMREPQNLTDTVVIKRMIDRFKQEENPQLIETMAESVVSYIAATTTLGQPRNFLLWTLKTEQTPLIKKIRDAIVSRGLIKEAKIINDCGTGDQEADEVALLALQNPEVIKAKAKNSELTDAAIRVAGDVLKTLAPNTYSRLAVGVGHDGDAHVKRSGFLSFDKIRALSAQARDVMLKDPDVPDGLRNKIKAVTFNSPSSLRYSVVMIAYLAKNGYLRDDAQTSGASFEQNIERVNLSERLCGALVYEAQADRRLDTKPGTVGALVELLSAQGRTLAEIAVEVAR